MKTLVASAILAAAFNAASFTAAEAHVKHQLRHHQPWCATHVCKPVRQHHYVRHYPVLDGTEPLCGFNDGTYMRNAFECGFR